MTSTFFLGACTPQGFLSHSDTLFEELDRLFIIKGGSGCGKSTFMRRIGAEAEARGLDVSYILCSSDPESLDGVLLPGLGVGFVDGTAPHVLEPQLCGGGANYLNFGEFYDEAGLRANEAEIRQAQRANAAQYPYVTACLAAAEKLSDAVHLAVETQRNTEEMEAIGQCLALSALKPAGTKGCVRRRFLEAVTPQGFWSCAESAQQLCERVYLLHDGYGLAAPLMRLLLRHALEGGHDCIACYAPLRPEGTPAHLLVPTAGAAFLCDSEAQPWQGEAFCRIDLASTLPPAQQGRLRFYLDTIRSAQAQAVRHMRQAKRSHDRIEQLCRPFVDFTAVDRLTQRMIEELF